MTEKVYSAPVLESLSVKATSDLGIGVNLGVNVGVGVDLPGLGS